MPLSGGESPINPKPTSPSGGSSGGTGGAGGSGGTAPVSTFCDPKIQALGAGNVLFCADFDDPSQPLGAWAAGSFTPDIFTKQQLQGGTATLSAGSLGTNASGHRLVIEKPANAGSSADTGAKYVASFAHPEPARGLRISFDIVMTRQNPVWPLGFLVFTEGLDFYGEDNNGSPAFVANDGVAKLLLGSGSPGALWHIDLVLDADEANSQYVFSGSLNGAPLASSGVSMHTVAQSIGSSLTVEIKASTLTNSDGSAVAQFDNVLVTTLD